MGYFDLSGPTFRRELTEDDVAAFMAMGQADQAVFLGKNADFLPADDLSVLSTLMTDPDLVRLESIAKDSAEEYERLCSLRLGPKDDEEVVSDLREAFSKCSCCVANQILGVSEGLTDNHYLMTALRNDLISRANLPGLRIFSCYYIDMNSSSDDSRNAFDALTQAVVFSQDDSVDRLDDCPLLEKSQARTAYLSILRYLLDHGARPYPEDALPSYTYKTYELSTRPELAFAALARDDVFFSAYVDALTNAFPQTEGALERWELAAKPKQQRLKLVSKSGSEPRDGSPQRKKTATLTLLK